ncbi:MAG: hypothetical protein JNN31_08270 [Dechloromonas sp.]|nr:hypothetical protein [Dechloromonas sp.]
MHLSSLLFLESRLGDSTPVELHRLTLSIDRRAPTDATEKPVRQQLTRKMAPQTEANHSPANTPEINQFNAARATYTSPDLVDELASVLDVPTLPEPTISVQEPGAAILVIYVGIDGFPDFVDVEQSSFPKDYTDLLAQHFKMARFKPATLFGAPVNSWTRIEVGLEDTNSPNRSQLLGTLHESRIEEPST